MISETYREIEIVLLENENKWRFTANGRERTAPTLPAAREAIDKALKAETKWEPVDAYFTSYNSSGPVRVTITSEAGGHHGNYRQFWISNNGKRSKESEGVLYAITPENDALFARIVELVKQQKALREQEKELLQQLRPIQIPTAV